MVILVRAHVNVPKSAVSNSEASHRLIVVTGKGGVGKSTVAAALALASANAGLRTLVCEVNAEERIAPWLGKPPAGPELTQLGERLWSVDVRPAEALKEYAMMTLKFESVYKAVFENRLVRSFLRFIPSLQELVLLGKVLFHVKETLPDGRPRFERVIIDAPATGHAITFLSVPQVLLQTVPPGALADDAKWMGEMLADPKLTAAVLVSLPEELPVNETLELHTALTTRVKVRPRAVVLNMFVPERFNEGDADGLPERLKRTAQIHRARSSASSEAMERLATTGLPVTALPRIHRAPFDRSVLEELAQRLTDAGVAR